MRILYVASDQTVPGRTGGSVHVLEVARGLRRRGHDVHAIVRRCFGQSPREDRDGVVFHRVGWWPDHRFFRFRAQPAVEAVADDVRPDVVIERYYNFGGEGVATARGRRLPALLEVNSPIIDHAGSLKALLDAALVVRPMRRRREAMCRSAAKLVSPLLEIVPDFARDKTVLVTWGADVDRFCPMEAAARESARSEFGLPLDATLVVFAGSFRPWHGVDVFEAAARRLSSRDDVYFVLAGGDASGDGRGYRGRRLGSVSYERMPSLLGACDIGVAPYDTSRLAQLRLGFYWSPLKVFEYMAAGLPTVTIPVAPLDTIVRDGVEGVTFAEGDVEGLARAIEALTNDPARRHALGSAARARVVDHYSWASHCRQLDEVLREIAA